MKKTEVLFTCDKCKQGNFTARGLKSHNCEKRIAAKSPAKQIIDPRHVALKDLSVPQLAEAFMDLDHAEQKYTRLSGVCATLKGLVLIEVKEKLPHGKYLPWLKENFKGAHKTSARHVQLAKAFLGKVDSNVKFDLLTKDLHASLMQIQHNDLDLTNPAVAAVADWVKERSAYQLLLELEDESGRGGDNNPRNPEKKKTHAEQLAELKETTREWAGEQLRHSIQQKKLWKLLDDEEITAIASHEEEQAKAKREWLKIPKSKRAQAALEDFAV